MKICILTTSFQLKPGTVAGPFVTEQSQQLHKLGAEVVVLAPHHPGALLNEDLNGVKVHRLRYFIPEKFQRLCYGAGIPTNLRNNWLARLQLPILFLSFFINGLNTAKRCDVIQGNWTIAGLAAIWIGKLLKKPVVLIMYGVELFVLKQKKLLRKPIEYILREADHVISISQFTAENVEEIQKPKAQSVIPPGVDVSRFTRQTDLDKLRNRLTAHGLDVNQPLAFALGAFIERKGYNFLIQAIAEARKRVPVQLVLGGRGPMEGELRKLTKDLGIQDYVWFAGFIPDDEMASYYSLATMIVSPEIVDSQGNTPGLGMTLIESLACETPCISSRVGGSVDIIKDGINGFLVEEKDVAALADRIVTLSKDPTLCREFGRQGRQFILDNFNWKTNANKILDIHEKVIYSRGH